MLHASLRPNLCHLNQPTAKRKEKTPECDDVEHRGKRDKRFPR